MITVKEIAWLAGILEGEGCFSNFGTPIIQINMTDKDTIEKIGHLFGRGLQNNINAGGYKPQYRVVISGTPAVEWMLTIYSLMSIRRKEKIREVVNKWMEQKSKGSKDFFRCGHPRTPQNSYYSRPRQTVCRTCALAAKKLRRTVSTGDTKKSLDS